MRVFANEAVSEDVDVTFAVEAGSDPNPATRDEDFSLANGTVTIPAGTSEAWISFTLTDDLQREHPETFHVRLTEVTSGALGDDLGVVEIRDDDAGALPPGVTASISTSAVWEGETSEFLVTLSTPVAYDVRFAFETADDTATSADDYAFSQGSLVIPAGQTSGSIKVPTQNDTSAEFSESFTLSLDNDFDDAAPLTASGEIIDDDSGILPPGVTFTVSDQEVWEGETARFVVTLSQPVERTVRFAYQTADDTATSTGDFYGQAESISFAAGEITKTISVSTKNDFVEEALESFELSLDNEFDDLPPRIASGTIVDDDSGALPPGVTFAVSNEEVWEGETARFVITLSQPVDRTVRFAYQTADGTATSTGDFYGKSGPLSFAAGETTKTISVSTKNDFVEEVLESFELSLDNALDEFPPRVATGTVVDDDSGALPPGVTFTVSDAEVWEGETARFVVTLSQPVDRTVRFAYQTADDTATSTDDFYGKSGPLSFAAGETTKTISVSTKNDFVEEFLESFELSLDNALDKFPPRVATGTIIDDDSGALPPGVTFTVSDQEVWEGETARFVVTLSQPVDRTVRFAYQTADDTATGTDDFYGKSGPLSFAAGETTKTISVSTKNDFVEEFLESFQLSLDNTFDEFPTHIATGTVVDDDSGALPPGVAFTVSDAEVWEGETARFVITLSQPVDRTVRFAYQSADDTATSTDDFYGKSGPLSFAAGETTKTISVSTKNDFVEEFLESFELSLDNAFDSFDPRTATGTIIDDDSAALPPGVAFSVSNAHVWEGNAASFVVTLSAPVSRPVSFGYNTQDDSATSTEDYISRSSSVLFAAGEISKTIPISTRNDEQSEPAEEFALLVDNAWDAFDERTSTAILADDDSGAPAPWMTVSIDSVSVWEGDSEEVSVRLSEPVDHAIRLDYSTVNADAIGVVSGEAGDFLHRSGELVFDAGTTERLIFLNTIDDQLAEADERFRLLVENEHWDDSADGNITIIDDESNILIAGYNFSGNEGSLLGPITLADFRHTDATPGVHHTVTIDWGDGETSSGQIIEQDPANYQVTGSHTYADDGNYSVTITAEDNESDASASIVVVATILNVAPTVSGGGSYSVSHNGTLSVASPGLLSGARDPGDDEITIAVDGQPALGSVVVASDGGFVYTPYGDALGTDSFSYYPSDGQDQGSTQTVTISVTNKAPHAATDQFEVIHDRARLLDVLANDSDGDGDPLTSHVASQPQHGHAEEQPDGTIRYTPDADYVGSDSFTYYVRDAFDSSSVVTVNLDVTNRVPRTTPDSWTISHDRSFQGNVAANDTDDDNDPFEILLVQAPQNGSLTLNGDGTFEYTPYRGYLGQDAFSYYATDGLGNSAETQVRLDVINHVPVANADEWSLPHDRSFEDNVVLNDTDGDSDALEAFLVEDVSHGRLTLRRDGSFRYSPNPAFLGADTFRYYVSDGLAVSAPVQVTLTVGNTAPEIDQPIALSMVHDRELERTLTDWVDDAENDLLGVTLISSVSNGHLDLQPDLSFTYTPDEAYTGSDTFSFVVSDGLAQSITATISIEVTNEPPVPQPDSYSLPHDRQFKRSKYNGLLANDRDSDGDTLTVSLVSPTTNGLLFLNDDGSFEYTPKDNFVGTDQFTYSVSDGIETSDEITVTLTVTQTAPVADDLTITLPHDQTLLATLTNFAADQENDALRWELVSQPSTGSVNLHSDGQFAYTTPPGTTGTTSFSYRVHDGLDDSNVATVTLVVTQQQPIANGVNAQPDYVTVYHDRIYRSALPSGVGPFQNNLGVLTNDRDPDTTTWTPNNASLSDGNPLPADHLSATLVTDVAHGTLSFNSNGTFAYQPDEGFYGTDTFQYIANDGRASSEAVTVQIVIQETAPVANSRTDQVPHGRTFSGVVSQSDSEADHLTATLIDPVTNQPTTAEALSASLPGNLTFQADGSFEFVPDGEFADVDIVFGYQLSDGLLQSGIAYQTLRYFQNVPVAGDDHVKVGKGQSFESAPPSGIAANDQDFEDKSSLEFRLVDPATGEEIGVQDLGLVGSLSGWAGDGSFVYQAPTDWLGTESFFYRTFDGLDYSNVAEVTLEVGQSAPVAKDDTVRVPHYASGLIAPLQNDRDDDGDVLQVFFYDSIRGENILIEDLPITGSLVPDGSGWTYTPDPGWFGTERFEYRAFDGTEYSEVATVTIDVPYSTPVANDDEYRIKTDGRLHAPPVTNRYRPHLLVNDRDPEGDAIEIASHTEPSNGVLSLDPLTGEFTYTPNSGFSGIDGFFYELSDGNVVGEPARVTFYVGNASPLASGDSYEVAPGEMITKSVVYNDVDPDGDILVAQLVDPVTGQPIDAGSLQLDGDFSWEPRGGFRFVANDTFTGGTFAYRLTDGVATSGIATVTLALPDPADAVANRPPVAKADRYAIGPNQVLSLPDAGSYVSSDPFRPIGFNDRDLNGDTLVYELVTDVNQGTLVLSADGSLTYTPDLPAGQASQLVTFEYRVSDGTDFSETVAVEIQVANRVPTSRNMSYEVWHDQVLNVGNDSQESLLNRARDKDGDSLSIVFSELPKHGSFSPDSQNGGFVYTPDAGYVGPDEFRYRLSDGTELSEEYIGRIDVRNSRPVASDQYKQVSYTDSLTAQLPKAQSADGDEVTAGLIGGPFYGSLTLSDNGGYTYIPDPGFIGRDTFTYVWTDNHDPLLVPITEGLESRFAKVTIDVTSSAPVATDDDFVFGYTEGPSYTLDLLKNDVDADNDSLQVIIVDQPTAGSLTHLGDGVFLYTPYESSATSSGSTFSSDEIGAAEGESATTAGGDLLTVGSHGSTLPEGESLAASSLETTSSSSSNSNSDTFTYYLSDGTSKSLLSSVSIGISPIAVTTTSSTFSAEERKPLTDLTVATFVALDSELTEVDFEAEVFWGDGETTAATIVPNGGGFDVVASHTYASSGNYELYVQVKDANGNRDGDTAAVVVSDAPTSVDGSDFTTTIGTAYRGTLATVHDDPEAKAEEFTARVNFGDGTGWIPTRVTGYGGSFSVIQGHTYDEEGTYAVEIEVTNPLGETTTDSKTATVTKPGSLKTVTVTAQAGDAFSGVVGKVTSFNRARPEIATSVSIDWGDGTVTPGSVAPNGDVFGHHRFESAGSFSVRLVSDGQYADGQISVVDGLELVEGGKIRTLGRQLIVTDSSEFSGPFVSVLLHPDIDPAQVSLRVDWGDGTETEDLAASDLALVSGSEYEVSGTHTYEETGAYEIRLYLEENGVETVAKSSVLVQGAPLVVGPPRTVNIPGEEAIVATFTAPGEASKSNQGYRADVDHGGGVATRASVSPVPGAETKTITNRYEGDESTSPNTEVQQININGNPTGGTFTLRFAGASTPPLAFNASSSDIEAALEMLPEVADVSVSGSGSVFTVTFQGAQANENVSSIFADGSELTGRSNDFRVYDYSVGLYGTTSTVRIYQGDLSRAEVSATVNNAFFAGMDDPLGTESHAPSEPPEDFDENPFKMLAVEGITISAREEQVFSGTVGTFIGDPGGWAVDIAWGDGEISPGTLSGTSITGTHTYTVPGSYEVKLLFRTIDHETHWKVKNSGGLGYYPYYGYGLYGYGFFNPYYDGYYYGYYASQYSYAVSTGAEVSPQSAPSLSASPALTTDVHQAISGEVMATTSAGDDATATIEWGDGTVSIAEINSSGEVIGNHTYVEPGFYIARVSVRDGYQFESGTRNIEVVPDAAHPLIKVLDPGSLSVAEDVELVDEVIARFESSAPRHIGGIHRAEIHWGDGSVSEGKLRDDGSGNIDVLGSHTYRDAGLFAVRVLYQEQGALISANRSLEVSSPSISLTVNAISTGTGAPLKDLVVAQFDVPAGSERTPDDYLAIIRWGDGTTSQGRLVRVGNTFRIVGSHTYSSIATYELAVTVIDGPATTQAITGTAAAHVGVSYHGGDPISIFAGTIGRRGVHFDNIIGTQDVHAYDGSHSWSWLDWSYEYKGTYYSGAAELQETIQWGDGTSGSTLSTYRPYVTGSYEVDVMGFDWSGDFESWGSWGYWNGWNGYAYPYWNGWDAGYGSYYADAWGHGYGWGYGGGYYGGLGGYYGGWGGYGGIYGPGWYGGIGYWGGYSGYLGGWYGFGGWGWGSGYGWGGWGWGRGWYGYGDWWGDDSSSCSGPPEDYECSAGGYGGYEDPWGYWYHHYDSNYAYDHGLWSADGEANHLWGHPWGSGISHSEYVSDHTGAKASGFHRYNWDGWWWAGSGTGSYDWSYDTLPRRTFGETFHRYESSGNYTLATSFMGDRSIHIGSEVVTETHLLPRLYGKESLPLNAGEVATFMRSGWFVGSVGAGGVTSTVDWGDGTTGTVDVGVTNDNRLSIDLGSHTYNEEGIYPVSILVEVDGQTRLFTTEAEIIDPRLAGTGADIYTVAQQDSGEVHLATLNDWTGDWETLSAVVKWDDSASDSPVSAAAVRLHPDDPTKLQVWGSNGYDEAGSYDFVVQVFDQSPQPLVLSGTATVIEGWTAKASRRKSGFGHGAAEAFGTVSVSPNTGETQIAHPLDFDLSPGTEVGLSPALVFNSETTQGRPIIETVIAAEAVPDQLQQIEYRVAWDGDEFSDWKTYTVASHETGDDYVVAMQVDHPFEATGVYPWKAQVRILRSGESDPYHMHYQGITPVVINQQHDLDPADPFDNQPFYGEGWAISGIDRLFFDENLNVQWVRGDGTSETYAFDGTEYVNPTGDFGTLSISAETDVDSASGETYRENKYVYKSRGDAVTYTFNSFGLLESVKPLDNEEHTIEYDDEGRPLTITAADSSTTMFVYGADDFLDKIVQPGGREVLFNGGTGALQLNQITSADGSVRDFGYDLHANVNRDAWGLRITEVEFDAATQAAKKIDLGLGTNHDVTAANSVAFDRTNVQPSSRIVGSIKSPGPVSAGTNKFATEYAFDSEGRLLRLRRPDNAELTWKYDEEHGEVLEAVDERGNTTTYKYYEDEAREGLLQWTDVPGYGKTEFEYHPELKSITKIKEPSGTGTGQNTTTFQYTDKGQLEFVIDVFGNSVQNHWNNYDLAWTEDERNNRTTYLYDGHRRVETIKDALAIARGYETSYTYDTNGNVKTVNDNRNVTTTYHYTPTNFLWKIDLPGGAFEQYTYDASGLLELELDPRGSLTKNEYDRRGLLVKTTEGYGTADARATSFDYHPSGAIYTVTDHLGLETKHKPDPTPALRKTTITGKDNVAYTETYDVSGNLLTRRGPTGTSSATYDQFGRLEYEYPNNAYPSVYTKYTYDALGQLAQVRDPVGDVTKYRYDVLGRLEYLDDAEGGTTRHVYDAAGNTESIYPPGRSHIQRTYDALNRVTKESVIGETGDGTRFTEFDYDPNGNLAWSRDYEGNQTDYTYDALGFVNTVTRPHPGTADHGRPITDYDYYPDGLLAEVTDPASRTTTYTYDALDRPKEVISPSGTTSYYYSIVAGSTVSGYVDETRLVDVLGRETKSHLDGYGRQIRLIHPDPDAGVATGPEQVWNYNQNLLAWSTDIYGDKTFYSYDNFDRLEKITRSINGESVTVSKRSYYGDSSLKTETAADGSVTTYIYDGLKRLRESRVASFGATATSKWDYDGNGDMYRYTSPSGSQTHYVYTDFGNMESEKIIVEGSALVRSYTHDENGRVLTKNDRNGRLTTYDYDNLGRVISEQSSGYTANFHYYVDGRLATASDTDGSGSISSYGYTFDPQGQADQITQNHRALPDSHAVNYDFDNGGQLDTRKIFGSGTVPIVAADLEYDKLGRVQSVTEVGQHVSDKHIDYRYHDFSEALGGGKIASIYRFDTQSVTAGAGESHPNYEAHSTYNYNVDNQLETLYHYARGVNMNVNLYAFHYDSIGRLKRIVPSHGGTVGDPIEYSYGAHGQLTSVQQAAAVTETFSYDSNGNRVGTNIGHDRVTEDASHRYTYDGEGNVIFRKDFKTTQSLPIDEDNTTFDPNSGTSYSGSISKSSDYISVSSGTFRLRVSPLAISGYPGAGYSPELTVTVYKNDGTLYDTAVAVHNETIAAGPSGVFPGAIIDFTHTSGEDLYIELSVDLDMGFFEGYRVDLEGAVYLDKVGASQKYKWDHRNRLIEVKDMSATGNWVKGYKYSYDVLNNLVGRESYHVVQDASGNKMLASTPYDQEAYLVVDGRRIVEYDATGSIEQVALYSPTDGSMLAVDSTSQQDGEVVWVFADHQGTANHFVHDSDYRRERRYTVFGDPITVFDASDPAKVGLRGMDYDLKLGMYYTGGRWYNPRSGRFASENPAGHSSGASNLYAFAGNTPVSRDGAGMDGNYSGAMPSGWDAFTDSFSYSVNPANHWNDGTTMGKVQAVAQGTAGAAGAVAGGILAGIFVLPATVTVGSFSVSSTALATVGVGAGAVSGIASTYAMDPNAGFGSYYAGGTLGALTGGMNPFGSLASIGGGLAAGAGNYAAGGSFSRGYLVGDLVGGIAGGGINDLSRKGLRHAAKFAAMEGGVAAAGGAAGYAATGTFDGALLGANFGSMAGGAAAARWVKCFVGGTPVYVPIEADDQIATTMAGVSETGPASLAWTRHQIAAGIAAVGLAAAALSHVAGPPTRAKEERPAKSHRGVHDELFASKEPWLDHVLDELLYSEAADEDWIDDRDNFFRFA